MWGQLLFGDSQRLTNSNRTKGVYPTHAQSIIHMLSQLLCNPNTFLLNNPSVGIHWWPSPYLKTDWKKCIIHEPNLLNLLFAHWLGYLEWWWNMQNKIFQLKNFPVDGLTRVPIGNYHSITCNELSITNPKLFQVSQGWRNFDHDPKMAPTTGFTAFAANNVKAVTSESSKTSVLTPWWLIAALAKPVVGCHFYWWA